MSYSSSFHGKWGTRLCSSLCWLWVFVLVLMLTFVAVRCCCLGAAAGVGGDGGWMWLLLVRCCCRLLLLLRWLLGGLLVGRDSAARRLFRAERRAMDAPIHKTYGSSPRSTHAMNSYIVNCWIPLHMLSMYVDGKKEDGYYCTGFGGATHATCFCLLKREKQQPSTPLSFHPLRIFLRIADDCLRPPAGPVTGSPLSYPLCQAASSRPGKDPRTSMPARGSFSAGDPP